MKPPNQQAQVWRQLMAAVGRHHTQVSKKNFIIHTRHATVKKINSRLQSSDGTKICAWKQA